MIAPSISAFGGRSARLEDNRRFAGTGPTRLPLVTYHVFVSWAFKEMSDRTSTDMLSVAEFAFKELLERTDLERDGAHQVELVKLIKPSRASLRREFASKLDYRVYVRWPGQRTTDRTSTDSALVAKHAFDGLVRRSQELVENGALAVVMTQGGQQVEYINLAHAFGARKDN